MSVLNATTVFFQAQSLCWLSTECDVVEMAQLNRLQALGLQMYKQTMAEIRKHVTARQVELEVESKV